MWKAFSHENKDQNVFMEFLIDFVKPEVIAQNKDVKKLKKINFHDTENQLPKTMISAGAIANKLLKKVNKDHPDHPGLFEYCFEGIR